MNTATYTIEYKGDILCIQLHQQLDIASMKEICQLLCERAAGKIDIVVNYEHGTDFLLYQLLKGIKKWEKPSGYHFNVINYQEETYQEVQKVIWKQ